MSEAPELNNDFRDLLGALTDAGVDFLVVGAHALAVHGRVRSTGDLDIFVKPTQANAERVLEALRRFGAPLAAHHVTPEDFARPDGVYQIGLPPRRIDILTSISGVDYDEAARDAQPVTIQAVHFRVPSRRAMILNKRATGRPKDLEDLRALEQSTEDA